MELSSSLSGSSAPSRRRCLPPTPAPITRSLLSVLAGYVDGGCTSWPTTRITPHWHCRHCRTRSFRILILLIAVSHHQSCAMQLRGAGRAAAETTKDEARAKGRKNTFSCGKKGPLFKETPGLQKWASRDADARSLLHLDHADLDRILRVAVLRSSAFQAREAAAQKEAAARTWCVVGSPPNV